MLWIQSNFQVTKKQQQQQQKQKQIKRLYKEKTFAPRVFHSVSVRTLTERHKKTQSTNRKARLEPEIRDAQTIAQNVFPTRPTLTSRSLQSICAATFSWILWKCSYFDLLSFYKGLGRKIFTQISFRMVLFSVWWR